MFMCSATTWRGLGPPRTGNHMNARLVGCRTLVMVALIACLPAWAIAGPITISPKLALANRPGMYQLLVEIAIEDGWYLYATVAEGSSFRPVGVQLAMPEGVSALTDWQASPASPYKNEQGTTVFRKRAVFTRTIRAESASALEQLEIVVRFQACNASTCLMPTEERMRCPRGQLPGGAVSLADLRQNGVYGFPQSRATVVCDREDLRVSVWNNDEVFVVQAMVWSDTSAKLGETGDGRKIGDGSTLHLDADANGKLTPERDRRYSLYPWPSRPGLYYSILYERGSSKLTGNSKGRGAIRYLPTTDGPEVRVDTFVVPLAEIERSVGEEIRFEVSVSSPTPEFKADTHGISRSRPKFENFHAYALRSNEGEFDVSGVPFGRDDPQPATRAKQDPPEIGSVPPEVFATSWLNTDEPQTLAKLRGQVVMVEFWGTWCGPCVAGIPDLNKLHEEFGDEGFKLLSFTDQSKAGIAGFMRTTPMHYTMGTGSELDADYGVPSYPHAYLIGKDGKLIWRGNPGDHEAMRARIVKALKD